MSDNLKLWSAIEKTPPEHTKKITGKQYGGTSPKPHYLVWKATETFGPCGIGWGFTVEEERIEEGAGGERMSIARVKVWYEWDGKRGEVEHIGGTSFSGTRASGKTYTDEDAPKKSVTDALIKALSLIGFAGDIFMGRYDDSKYVDWLRNETTTGSNQTFGGPLTKTDLKKQLRAFAGDLAACGDTDELAGCLLGYKEVIEQCERDLPDWFHNEDGNGASQAIAAKKIALSQTRQSPKEIFPDAAE